MKAVNRGWPSSHPIVSSFLQTILSAQPACIQSPITPLQVLLLTFNGFTDYGPRAQKFWKINPKEFRGAEWITHSCLNWIWELHNSFSDLRYYWGIFVPKLRSLVGIIAGKVWGQFKVFYPLGIFYKLCWSVPFYCSSGVERGVHTAKMGVKIKRMTNMGGAHWKTK